MADESFRRSLVVLTEIRGVGKRVAILAAGERTAAALELAGLGEQFDTALTGPRTAATLEGAIAGRDSDIESALAVDVDPDGVRAPAKRGFIS